MKFAISLVLVLMASSAGALGIDRGNGSGYSNIEDFGSWFTGKDKTIAYCLRISPTFGVSRTVAKDKIEAAFKAWPAYWQKKSLAIDIPAKIQETANCEKADIQFLLGSALKAGVARGEIQERLAAAVKDKFSDRTSWGRGRIWVVDQGSVQLKGPAIDGEDPVFPNWSAPDTLQAILTHEWGHVFGSAHIDRTIMREDVALLVEFYDFYSQVAPLTSIDRERQLIQSEEPMIGRLSLPSAPAENGFHGCSDESDMNFMMLVGRHAVGPIVAQFKTRGFSPPIDPVLELRDNQGSYNFPLQVKAGIENLGSENPPREVFGVTATDGRRFVYSSWYMNYSRVVYGTLQTAMGTTLPIAWELNTTSRSQRGATGYEMTGSVLKWISPLGPRFLFATSITAVSTGSTRDEVPYGDDCIMPIVP